MKKGTLLLANGVEFEGVCFGAEGTVIGEVVFTTSAVGYQEALSDPAYHGQILLQTFPLIGNYGTNDEDYASASCHVTGYLVREWCDTPSNFRMQDNIDHFLKKHGIIGLCGIDTRRLTHILREQGTMNGVIFSGESDKAALLEQLKSHKLVRPAADVAVKEPVSYPAKQEAYRVAVLDFGYDRSLVAELNRRGCSVTVFPALTTAEQIKQLGMDGIVLSDGPGNPEDYTDEVANIKEITALGLPIFGISLGHQLLAMAMGAKTKKLLHGHRGASQPVVDLRHGRTYVTAQNHGYIVDKESLSSDVGTVSCLNANDKSCEGIDYLSIPAFSVQFRPNVIQYRSAPESEYDRFVQMLARENA